MTRTAALLFLAFLLGVLTAGTVGVALAVHDARGVRFDA